LRRRHAAILLLAAIAALGVWSYQPGGLVAALVEAPEDGGTRLEAFRQYVLGWGALAPVVYVAAVTVEVVVAPIPGAILYAPGGAIFGGLIGGTLSLIGNVAGAAIAAWLGATFGADRVARRADAGTVARIRDRLAERGGWLVFALRINPLTSSDLVSYAAGLAGVPVRHVALASLFGLAPQCYAQAYFAASLFEILPGSPWLLLVLAIAITAVVIWRLIRE
jgi:uncharacterized membrane protein YdjX (TVP38/TMEM64 family)